jgi:uncharacterized DUF497 family protein
MSIPPFEWDPAKAASSLTAHGVAFEEAATVFADPLAMMHSDPDHSLSERRALLTGHSGRGRLLLVSFTDRGSTIRIISARLLTRRERRKYEESR